MKFSYEDPENQEEKVYEEFGVTKDDCLGAFFFNTILMVTPVRRNMKEIVSHSNYHNSVKIPTITRNHNLSVCLL